MVSLKKILKKGHFDQDNDTFSGFVWGYLISNEVMKNVISGTRFTRRFNASWRASQPCLIIWSTYERQEGSGKHSLLNDKFIGYHYRMIMILYLGVSMSVSLAYYNLDLG